MKTIPIYAHRGVSSNCVENTFEAFRKAIDVGADGIELDVQLSKDGVLVVFHDFSLKRLAGKKSNINDFLFEELRTFKIGSRFQRIFKKYRISTLREVLDWAIDHKVALNIELKESILSNEPVLIQFLTNVCFPENLHFSSFHERLLRIVKEQRPEIETAYIVTKKFNWAAIEEDDFYDTIHASKKYYKRSYLKYIEQTDVGIRFYGITGSEDFLLSPHPSVIGWITDFPTSFPKSLR